MSFLKKKELPRERRALRDVSEKPAYSYYAGDKRDKTDSVRARHELEQKRRLGKGFRLLPTLIALLAIVFSIVYNTTLSTAPYIVYAGDASPYQSKEYYQTHAEAILSSSYKNRSKLTLNAGRTEEALLKEFSEFDVLKLTMPVIGRRPTLTVHVRQPALLLSTSSNIYAIDINGRVVAEAQKLASSVKETLLSVQDQSGITVKVGGQALTTETVAFIIDMNLQIKDKNLNVSQMVLPTTPNEVDIRIKDLPYYIKADTTGQARVQAGAFIAVKESGIVPTEYIDVRVEEKVFYK